MNAAATTRNTQELTAGRWMLLPRRGTHNSWQLGNEWRCRYADHTAGDTWVMNDAAAAWITQQLTAGRWMLLPLSWSHSNWQLGAECASATRITQQQASGCQTLLTQHGSLGVTYYCCYRGTQQQENCLCNSSATKRLTRGSHSWVLNAVAVSRMAQQPTAGSWMQQQLSGPGIRCHTIADNWVLNMTSSTWVAQS
jgi:hypothetical protein